MAIRTPTTVALETRYKMFQNNDSIIKVPMTDYCFMFRNFY